jgi:putative heme transporter
MTTDQPTEGLADGPDVTPPDVTDPDVGQPDLTDSDGRPPSHLEVPRPVRVAADWAWRLLVIAAAVLALLLLADRLKLLILAVFVATLLTALLLPAVRWVQRVSRLSRGFATTVVLVVAVSVLAMLLAALAVQIGNSLSDLGDKFADGLTQIRGWLRDTFGIDDATLQRYLQQAWDAIQSNRNGLLSGALSGTRIALEVLSGAAIALFATVFMLLDGDAIWAWCVRLFPRRSQGGVHEVGQRSWLVLTAYVRGTVLIAFVDAVSIGLALAILRVPLAVPLAALVFVGAFVPIVGAFVSGFVAVVVALATRGPVVALLVLAAIILIQQIEGHLLQPLVMGRLVRLHPLGVVVAVTAGSVLAGLVGAVVAVPLAAVLVTVFGYYSARSRAAATDTAPAVDTGPGTEDPVHAEDAQPSVR